MILFGAGPKRVPPQDFFWFSYILHGVSLRISIEFHKFSFGFRDWGPFLEQVQKGYPLRISIDFHTVCKGYPLGFPLNSIHFQMVLGIGDFFGAGPKRVPPQDFYWFPYILQGVPLRISIEFHTFSNGFRDWGPFLEQVQKGSPHQGFQLIFIHFARGTP